MATQKNDEFDLEEGKLGLGKATVQATSKGPT